MVSIFVKAAVEAVVGAVVKDLVNVEVRKVYSEVISVVVN